MTTTASQQSGEDFFSLNRPQYVATPEVLLSSLVWRGVPADAAPKSLSRGLVYRALGKAKVGVDETSPTARDGEDRLARLRDHLRETCGLEGAKLEFAASVMVEQLESQKRAKAKSVGVLPLNLTAALMQNASGVLGVDNPPNYGGMLERMFELGGSNGANTASGLLIGLYQGADDSDAAMSWLGDCIDVMAPPEISALSSALVEQPRRGQQPAWLKDVPTPYRWFHDAWTSLCIGEWLGAMPRRRWVDWATCVLRTAIGTGFLYEMSFYYRLVLFLTDPRPAAELAEILVRPDPGLLRWDPRQSTSKQDIASPIQRLSHTGSACRAFLIDCQGANDFPRMGDHVSEVDALSKWIEKARHCAKNPELLARRREILAFSRIGSGKNMYETITGSLVARSGGLGWVDSYSMLKKRGSRYTLVDPGQDWLTVIASLAAGRAGAQSRVADLLRELGAIGLRPGYTTIVEQLESAGLARSSHDADDAVEIAAAF